VDWLRHIPARGEGGAGRIGNQPPRYAHRWRSLEVGNVASAGTVEGSGTRNGARLLGVVKWACARRSLGR